ncbi:MAG: hypothetical protein E4H02_09370 [Lentisphaerales bacterium]|jgi:hypothetical protein|nr:MAG: hypothetical protein E4H02_09370 [Lentisphaerales bacterium]
MIKLEKIPINKLGDLLDTIKDLEDSGKEVKVAEDHIDVGGVTIRIVSKTEEQYLLHIKSDDSLRSEFESLIAAISKHREV